MIIPVFLSTYDEVLNMAGAKRKTIVSILRNKLDSWINTIDDAEVQQLVKMNTIVTGGSIASMLMGETINDYDVYFRNRETTIAVAKYYLNKFNEKNNHSCIHPENNIHQNF
jgi:hypothetical protein